MSISSSLSCCLSLYFAHSFSLSLSLPRAFIISHSLLCVCVFLWNMHGLNSISNEDYLLDPNIFLYFSNIVFTISLSYDEISSRFSSRKACLIFVSSFFIYFLNFSLYILSFLQASLIFWLLKDQMLKEDIGTPFDTLFVPFLLLSNHGYPRWTHSLPKSFPHPDFSTR